ncbi:hypothetical protein HNY73_019215 [Argiope bruennichi]|uniref:Uncharacterized protein n=1 Tax=Argiope bruennichi TaxID=94029 RepID=A0A8T0EFQ1_ARGBR|nr:hypothetical protein HNY73_019215 [Argiope bruennichi]
MGNRKASLFTASQLKEVSMPCLINAVQTRSQTLRIQNKKKNDNNLPLEEVKLAPDDTSLSEQILLQEGKFEPRAKNEDFQIPSLNEHDVVCIEAGTDCERHLLSALYALRAVIHESTGFCPPELVFEKLLRTPEMLLYEKWAEAEIESSPVIEHVFNFINRLKRCQELATEKMVEMQLKRKKWYDKNAIKCEFLVGDLVLVLLDQINFQFNG